MNEFIKDQLSKIKVANIGIFDEKTLTYHIPKTTLFNFKEDTCYLIKLNDILLNDTNLVLVSNWNNGSIPKERYMKVDVVKVLGTMIKVNGLGYDMENSKDLNYMWSGWLPSNQVEVIKTL